MEEFLKFGRFMREWVKIQGGHCPSPADAHAFERLKLSSPSLTYSQILNTFNRLYFEFNVRSDVTEGTEAGCTTDEQYIYFSNLADIIVLFCTA